MTSVRYHGRHEIGSGYRGPAHERKIADRTVWSALSRSDFTSASALAAHVDQQYARSSWATVVDGLDNESVGHIRLDRELVALSATYMTQPPSVDLSREYRAAVQAAWDRYPNA